jgi:hypothetical protein
MKGNYTSDAVHLFIAIRGLTESCDVVEQLVNLKSLHGTTTGEDLFLSACEAMKELEFPWTKLKRVTTEN